MSRSRKRAVPESGSEDPSLRREKKKALIFRDQGENDKYNVLISIARATTRHHPAAAYIMWCLDADQHGPFDKVTDLFDYIEDYLFSSNFDPLQRLNLLLIDPEDGPTVDFFHFLADKVFGEGGIHDIHDALCDIFDRYKSATSEE